MTPGQVLKYLKNQLGNITASKHQRQNLKEKCSSENYNWIKNYDWINVYSFPKFYPQVFKHSYLSLILIPSTRMDISKARWLFFSYNWKRSGVDYSIDNKDYTHFYPFPKSNPIWWYLIYVRTVFKTICVLVHWTKVDLELEGLIHIESISEIL